MPRKRKRNRRAAQRARDLRLAAAQAICRDGIMPVRGLELWEYLEDAMDLMYGPGLDGTHRSVSN